MLVDVSARHKGVGGWIPLWGDLCLGPTTQLLTEYYHWLSVDVREDLSAMTN